MKYIRTKDNIYKSEEYWKKPPIEIMDINEEIIAQANFIDELCNEFVLIRNNEKPHLLRDYDDLSVLKGRTIYGAIWTEKGLIYVAKMNDKGDLELL